MNTLYRKFRDAGMPAQQAFDMAKTVLSWHDWEDNYFDEPGAVRLRLEPEDEAYFDVYGEPEAYTDGYGRRVTAEQARQDIIDQIDRDGCWCLLGEYWDGTDWVIADSIGMLVGYDDPMDPAENWYVGDIMSETLRQAAAAFVDWLADDNAVTLDRIYADVVNG